MPSSTISTSGSTSQDSRLRATTSSAPTTATLPATNPSPNPRCGRIARANRRVRSPPAHPVQGKKGHQMGGVVAHHHDAKASISATSPRSPVPTSTARAPAAPSLPGPVRAAQAGLPAPTSTPPQPRTSGRPPLIVHTIAAITVSTPTAQHVGGKIIWWPSSAVLVGNRLGHRTRVHRGGASCINERGSSLQFRVPVRKASPDGIAGARSTSVAVAWVAEDSAPRHLIIRLIIHTIRRDPSGSIWIDEASNVSSPDRSGADQIDTEHQATDLAVGGSNPSRRATITAAQRPCDGIAVSCRAARLRPSCTTLAGSPKVTPPARPVRAAVAWPLPTGPYLARGVVRGRPGRLGPARPGRGGGPDCGRPRRPVPSGKVVTDGCRWCRPGACQACFASSRQCWGPSGSTLWPTRPGSVSALPPTCTHPGPHRRLPCRHRRPGSHSLGGCLDGRRWSMLMTGDGSPGIGRRSGDVDY